MTPAHAAEMACMMDPAPGEEDHCPEMSELAFHWMEKGLKSVARDATPMIRASVVDLRAPERRPAAEELRAKEEAIRRKALAEKQAEAERQMARARAVQKEREASAALAKAVSYVSEKRKTN